MAAGGKNVYRAALGHPAVRWISLAHVQSRIGDFMYSVALIAVVFVRTHSPVDVTITAVAIRLPLVVLPPFAGLLVDRVERRQLMLSLDGLRCLVMVVIAGLVAAKAPIALVVAAAAVVAALSTAYGPAEVALTAAVVPEDDLGAANAMRGAIESLAIVAGPALGALVLIVGSPTVAIAVDAVTFAVSAACLSRVARGARPEPATRERGGQLLAGFRALGSDGGLAVVTLALVACCLGVGAANVLFLVVSAERLGTGTHGLGYLLAAAGVGGLIATALADRLSGLRRMAIVVAGLLAVSGTALGMLAVVTDQVAAYLVIAIWGGAYLLLEVLSTTLLQRCVDAGVLGRASAAVDVVAYGAILLGGALAGPIAEHVGVRAAVIAVSAPSLAVAVVITWRARTLDARASAVEDALAPVRAALRAASVFAGVRGPALEALAVAATSQTVAAGTVVVRQGQPADDLYVVVDGTFDVTSSGGRAARPTFVRSLGAGDVFGEIGLLESRPRTATVTATTAATVYRVPGQDFMQAVSGGGSAFAGLRALAGDRLMRTHGATAAVTVSG